MTTKIGFFGLLFLIFLTLKLTGEIAWSWLWVTAPIWGPLALVGVVFVPVVVFNLIRFVRRQRRSS